MMKRPVLIKISLIISGLLTFWVCESKEVFFRNLHSAGVWVSTGERCSAIGAVGAIPVNDTRTFNLHRGKHAMCTYVCSKPGDSTSCVKLNEVGTFTLNEEAGLKRFSIENLNCPGSITCELYSYDQITIK